MQALGWAAGRAGQALGHSPVPSAPTTWMVLLVLLFCLSFRKTDVSAADRTMMGPQWGLGMAADFP